MTEDLREQVSLLEKENRRIRQKLRHSYEALKVMEEEKNQIQEESFKEKAMPAHYQDIEEKLDYYKKMVDSLASENQVLQNKIDSTPVYFDERKETAVSTSQDELMEKVTLQEIQIETLIEEKNQIKQELKHSKAEIAEVLIDAKMRARKIVETADEEVIEFKNKATLELALFQKKLQETQQTILRTKLDVTHLFDDIDIKMNSISQIEMTTMGGNDQYEK